MKSLGSIFVVVSMLVAACGSGDSGVPGDNDVPDAGAAPTEGFRIVTPDIPIQPGEEVTYCYYTTIPITREMGVKRWSSTMTPGSHHLILFFATGASMPDGTIEKDCGGLGGGGFNIPYWTYSAQTAVAESRMPAGIGMTVGAMQKVYVQMHYVNTGDEVLNAHVVVDADAYPAAETYTPAAAYITYRAGFTIGANSLGETGGSCEVPAGARFFSLSTHTHRRGILTRVTDGDAMVFESDNWEHPGAAAWAGDPFFAFGSNQLTYHCEYDNRGNTNPVSEGASAKTDEMCMAVGYFFPATAPKICLNSALVN